MYQIFVVEDELLIRQNIRNTIEKMQGPYSCCGEASDGEMALSMMQDLMPDILITDIRMPFLDGFGLIQHVKKTMPWLKIVIISGYGDFAYAQKAISFGVDQYLLKPVRPGDLEQVIRDMGAQIEADRTRNRMPENPESHIVQLALKKHFMQQLLYGGTDTAALLEQAGSLQLNIVSSHYLVAVCFFDAPELNYEILHTAAQNLLLTNDQILFFFNAADQVTLLLYDNDPEELNERAYQSINILRHELQDICPVITAVVDDPVQRLGQISESHKHALQILMEIRKVAAGQTINVGDTARLTADIVTFEGPFHKDIQKKLQSATVQDVPAIMEEMLSGPDREQFGSMLVRCDALVFLMKVTVHIIADNTPSEEESQIAARLSARYDIFTAAQQFDTFKEMACRMLEEGLATKKTPYTEVKYSHVIHMAEKYVLENFCDPNISLISVAGHVGMSAAHFSTIFSQKQNRTFINYLTSLRMEKAKELLDSTNMKLADIALEIGYNEPNYFSHVFRKMEGITPKEYRNRSDRKQEKTVGQ